MSDYKIGTKFIAPTGDTYILSKVDNSSYALIGLSTGNRCANPCKVPSGYSPYSLDGHRLLAMMNDSSYTSTKVWEEVAIVAPVAATPVPASKIEFPVKKKKKPDVVQVTRFFRPILNLGGEIDSSRGITVNFIVNYVTDSFVAKWSVCNGDNFNKQLGIELAALNTKKAVSGNYDRSNDLFTNLHNTVLKDPSKYDRHLVEMLDEISDDRAWLGKGI